MDSSEEFYSGLFAHLDIIASHCAAIRIVSETDSSLDKFVEYIQDEVESLELTIASHLHAQGASG